MEPFKKILFIFVQILNDVSPWLIVSFIVAGLVHSLFNPQKFQRMLGNRKTSSLIKATLSGMLLPICSCGVIPLGLGLYYTGAFLGPTLAFMVATPIINPAAILLAYGLLGPQIATIYLICGFVIPMLTGFIGNWLAGPEIQAPGLDQQTIPLALESDHTIGIFKEMISGLVWGFKELGVMVSKYVVFGIFLAGLIIAVVPSHYIQSYLGNPGMVSITGIAALGSVMYVCAVGHIPFVAALVASGAAPGVAITFLISGAATNLPELISIFKMIGKRAVAIYTVMLVGLSMLTGLLTNKLLLPGFVPFFNLDEGKRMIGMANYLIFSVPPPLKYLCSALIFLLCGYSLWPRIQKLFLKKESLYC